MGATYAYYRFFDDKWIFETFNWPILGSVAYLDILFIPVLYPFLIVLIFHFKEWKSPQIHDFFIEDISISNGGKDVLNRLPLAKDLAKKIGQQRFEKSFSVGIIGSWGSGKSSFFELLKEELDFFNQNSLFVDFNSFYNHRSEDIIKEFFTTISLSVKPYNGRLSSQIEDYRDNILSLIQEHGLSGINRLFALFKNNRAESIQNQYLRINKAIKTLGKKIIVFIDDVDRLRAKEIIQVLKIIRNTADFPNTVYFVAFDKEYVIEALEKHAEYRSESFIEKYFQYELILPPIHKNILRQKFLELIEGHLDKKNLKDIGDSITPGAFMFPSIFDNDIHTLRDVIRLANTFIFEYEKVNGEVDINDLVNLLILKNKFISAYEILASNPFHYLEVIASDGYENSDEVLKLKLVQNTDASKDADNRILLIHLEQKGLYEGKIDSLKELLGALFPMNNQGNIPHLSIRIRRNLDKYFKLGELSGDISNNEFNDCLESGFDRFKESLNKWMENGQEALVISRIRSKARDRNNLTKPQYWNLFDALFYIGLNTIQANVRNYVFDALEKIVWFDGLIRKGLIAEQSEVGKQALQLIEKGSETNSDFDFSSWFIYKLIKHNRNENDIYWGVPLQAYQDRQEIYFMNFIGRLKKAEWHLYYLYYRCNEIGIEQSINERFKQFLKSQDYKQFLSDMIDRDTSDEIYDIGNIVERIFGSYPNFGTFLETLEDSPELKEFKIFYKLFSFTGFSRKVYFQFKAIKHRHDPSEVRIHQRMERQLFLKVKNAIVSRVVSDFEAISEKLKPVILTPYSNSYFVLENWERLEMNEFKEKVVLLLSGVIDDAEINMPNTFKPGQAIVTKNKEKLVEVFWYQD
ncbi:MAG: P-loop NTPase fold protein [Cyclobacteriaceae bacterium]